jgi:hypothetical protein
VIRSLARPLVRSLVQSAVRGDGVSEPAEFIENGEFDSSDGWTLGAGWTIAGGVASNDGTTGVLSRALVQPLIAGNNYVLEFSYLGTTITTLEVLLSGDSNQVVYSDTPPEDVVVVPFTADFANTTINIRDTIGGGLPEMAFEYFSITPA